MYMYIHMYVRVALVLWEEIVLVWNQNCMAPHI